MRAYMHVLLRPCLILYVDIHGKNRLMTQLAYLENLIVSMILPLMD